MSRRLSSFGGAGLARVRSWIELFVAASTGILGAATLFSHDWIESVFGADPDHGDGSLEWLIVAGLLGVSIISATLALADLRRLRLSEA